MACLVLPASAPAALPDLLSDPAGGAYTEEYAIGGESRLLLRFNSYIRNAGNAGPVQVLADQKAPDKLVMTRVRQVVEGLADPQPMPRGEVAYAAALAATADGHNHWHLQNAAEYGLTSASGGEFTPAAKVGFCLLNSQPTTPGAQAQDLGGCGTQGSTEVRMGISPGFRDLYAANLDFQWVDVSRVAPGTYLLRSDVDPDDVVDEAGDEDNAPSTVPVRIPGHVARSVAGARAVELRADRVEPMLGDLGPPEYKLLAAPQHGTVDREVGTWSSDPLVTYTPDDPANPRPDAVEYVARAAGSAFPIDPPRATAAFGQGSPVTIEGAPETMLAGTTVALRAGEPVTWSASAGRIAPDGTFTAPGTVGEVRVRAVTAGGSAAVARIAVVAPPVPQAAPLPAGAPPGDPAIVPPRPLAPTPPVALPRKAFVSARAQRVGRFVAVTVVPGRTGVLRFSLRRGSRTVDRCRVRATPGRSVTCRLRPPMRGRGRLRVVVQLVAGAARPVSRAVAVRSGHVH